MRLAILTMLMWGMHSRDLLEVVIDQGYDALVMNAPGSWVGVPREDILRILQGVWSEEARITRG